MQRPKKRSTAIAAIAGLGITGMLGLVLAASPALAEDPAVSPSTSSSASASAAELDREAQRAQRRDEFATALAAELGVDKAKVAAAVEKVQTARHAEATAGRVAELKTRLDAAVAAGTLTAEQSAAILKAAEAGVLPTGGRGGGPGGGPGGGHGR